MNYITFLILQTVVETERTAAAKQYKPKNVDKNKQIFIGKLDYSITEDQIKEHFGKYGAFDNAFIIPKPGKPNCGFVHYKEAATVKWVLDNVVGNFS